MGDSLAATIAAGEFSREDRQERHARWYAENMAILRASGLRFREHATSVVFRDPGKPKVEFYPHAGSWRIPNRNGGRICGRGGAAKFIAWYARQVQA